MNSTTKREISRMVIDAVPTSGYLDSQPDRYRVWMSDRGPVIKGRTKRELRQNIYAYINETSKA